MGAGALTHCGKLVRLAAAGVFALAACTSAPAQISPGKLSAPHAHLDDSGSCLECHDREHGVAPDRCLACHETLAREVARGQGLHARPGYRDCRKCHIEHHGEEFQLVWWGDEGTSGFDHQETGYRLEGAHASLDCRKCHRRDYVRGGGQLLARGKDLDRTFLGLDPACLSCHEDAHREQYASDRCLTCHTMRAWKPADGFDHGRTAYPLVGRHREATCASCHLPRGIEPANARPGDLVFTGLAFAACDSCHDDVHRGQFDGTRCESCHSEEGFKPARFDHARSNYPLTGKHRDVECYACHKPRVEQASSSAPSPRRFRGVPHAECSDCHRDVHAGRLGPACASCHVVEGWRATKDEPFDHDRTRYPLRGRHIKVECTKCHPPGRGLTVAAFERCATCHADPHLGQFASRTDRGACESCHDVFGFRPSRFTLANHQVCDYPLEGAHGATPCDRCHRKVAPAELPVPVDGRIEPVTLFTFPSTRCLDCHEDPHAGALDRFADASGCSGCHAVTGWGRVTFDHARTGSTLEGAHATASCSGCHRKTDRGAERLVWVGIGTGCTDCHRNPHGSQFDRAGVPPDCRRCHTLESWKKLSFDHDRDSVFRVDGAHESVPCAGCHRLEKMQGQDVVRYRPLPVDCKACHGESSGSASVRLVTGS
jgi:hypothetical protein